MIGFQVRFGLPFVFEESRVGAIDKMFVAYIGDAVANLGVLFHLLPGEALVPGQGMICASEQHRRCYAQSSDIVFVGVVLLSDLDKKVYFSGIKLL